MRAEACPVTDRCSSTLPVCGSAAINRGYPEELEAHDLGAAYASLTQSKQMGLSHLRQRKAEGQPHEAQGEGSTTMPASRAPSSKHISTR